VREVEFEMSMDVAAECESAEEEVIRAVEAAIRSLELGPLVAIRYGPLGEEPDDPPKGTGRVNVRLMVSVT
jgi:hypothetical protein